ncbi:M81 family peptidase [Mesorhizobium sp. M1A.F.Ca.ET.072.01.1.1]|uniref:M81 family metallopeptidase n=1 Tax=Mesorhizobium sp. M1A.F.Ca.ET.072.01.1.1 TaxID=2496753 RepID=UPI000FD26C66|nr:M81 family metallopeptidase [Mesorhizobium sp. M1A.F.Ca.ET.072.01.1.1]RUW54424.1 M81 family peptidase [Mesorhizobium sp. M1A.F.Ca.ET.072.01.1.1]TIV04817.1 MAG: M81 family metallopeptidase [Mesorhizobium sp.]
MKVAIAGFSTESVSFLANRLTVEDFKHLEWSGNEILRAHRGMNTVPGGFIDVCEREGIDMVPIVHAEANATAPVSDEAFNHYCRAIIDGLKEHRGSLDGVLLFLHGACTTPTRLDPDRDLLLLVRAEVGPEIPVMLALDYHGNLDASTIEGATATFGYHYSPHIDMADTGRRAAECLIKTLRGEISPVTAIARPGVMVPSIFSATTLQPLSRFVARSIELPQTTPGVLDVSIFAGFSYADVPNCGFSVVVVADGDRSLAERVANDLSKSIHDARRELHVPGLVRGLTEGVSYAVERAKSSKAPIVVLEHADRMIDSTYVLQELMRLGIKNAAVPFLWDPESAAAACRAGVGKTIKLNLGGHSSARSGGPVAAEAKVLYAGEKSFSVSGPMCHGLKVDLGPTALLDVDGIVVSVTTAPTTAVDEDPFLQFGLRPQDFSIIVLRSKTHFRAVYEPLAEEIVIVDTPDWGPADLTTLPYRHAPTATSYPFVDYD